MGLKSELEASQRSNQQLEQLLAQHKAKAAEFDALLKVQYPKLAAAEDGFKNLQQANRVLSEGLAAKSAELRKAEAELMQLERKAGNLPSLEDQVAALKKQLQEADKSGQSNRIVQLETDLARLKDETRAANERIRALQADNAKLVQTVQQLEDCRAMLKAKAKIEDELHEQKAALEAAQKKENELVQQVAEFKRNLHDAQQESAQNQRRAEEFAGRIAGLERDLKMQTDECAILKAKLDLAAPKHPAEPPSTAAPCQDPSVERPQVQSKGGKSARTLQKELEASKAREAAQADRIHKLKSLVETLDSTKDELVTRVKSATQAQKAEADEKAALAQQVEKLKADLATRAQEQTAHDDVFNQFLKQRDNEIRDLRLQLEQTYETHAKAQAELRLQLSMLPQPASPSPPDRDPNTAVEPIPAPRKTA